VPVGGYQKMDDQKFSHILSKEERYSKGKYRSN
jgi:hypothetical protein